MDSFDILLDDDLRLVKVCVTGDVSESDGRNVISTARELASEHNYNILYDMREAITNVPFAGWFRIPRELDVFKTSNAKIIKAAIIITRTDNELKGYRFYETVTYNLGFRIRIFFDENEAMDWLMSKSTGSVA
jgi:hypothetical protein